MRSLTAADNTDAATGDYPYRKARDTVGPTEGTKLWERIFADMIHGIQKLIRLVGITPNDLPDNESNGYQILDALELLGQSRVFQGNWTDAGGGDKYLLASGIPALIIGKMYRFISDKNLLPSDNIYLKVDIVDYAINFQNCSFILADQAFNVYVTGANNVIITTVGTLNEYLGSAINRFEQHSGVDDLGGIFKYKGKYYVTVSDNDQINIYSNEGNLELSFGASGSSDGQLDFPAGITVINDKIYVANTGNSRIEVFNLTGSFLFNFGQAQLISPSVIRSSEATGKIYVVDGSVSLNNAFAYNAPDGLYSFTFSGADKFKDIVIHDKLAYILSIPGSGETYIKRHNAENGSLLSFALNTFTVADNILKFYGINDNYFFLKSGNDVVLVDRNYDINDAGDPYRDILKTVIYGYSFQFGDVDGGEMYFIDNSSAADRFSINKFI